MYMSGVITVTARYKCLKGCHVAKKFGYMSPCVLGGKRDTHKVPSTK